MVGIGGKGKEIRVCQGFMEEIYIIAGECK